MSVNVSYKSTLHSYGVSRAMLVHNLKQEISERQNLHQFKLMLGQLELPDQCPVITYLFTAFTLCYDDKVAVVEINDFTLAVAVVNPEDQKFFTEKATPEMTVGQVKERISRKLISTQGKWTLKKDGKDVPDADLLKTHLDVKTFTVKTQDMHVILNYCGRFYSLATRSDMTILEFKRLCSKEIGITIDCDVCLVFNGTDLNSRHDVDDPEFIRFIMDVFRDDGQSRIEEMREENRVAANRTLAYLGITDNSVIITVVKLRGGFNRF